VIFVPGTRARTDREQVATLDRELHKEMVEFDGMMLREREGVKERDNEHAAGTGGAGGFDSGYGGPPPGAGGYPGDPNGPPGPGGYATGGPRMQTPPIPPPSGRDSGGGHRPSDPGDNRSGDYQHAAAAANVPDDIPDARDDDIVARQLREAAMSETDPELREKLWDEYRKYKRELKSR
jgi:hypothetical protein